MIRIMLLLGAVYLPSVLAESIEVEYASFYSHVKKLDSEDTQALRFAFGFKHVTQGRLCKINQAKIVTQKQTIPLEVEANQRFTVPIDKILKMAKAMVAIDFQDNANQCDMSVQLETRKVYLKTNYSADELMFLLQQYQAFFSEMGGFLSFMMPSVKGLVIQLPEGAQLDSSIALLTKQKGMLRLDEKWISQSTGLSLAEKPIRITAWVEK